MEGFRYRLDPLLARRKTAKQEAEAELAVRLKDLREAQKYAEELAGKESEARERRDAGRRHLLQGSSEGRTVAQRVDHLRSLERAILDARTEWFAQRQEVERCEERVTAARRDLAERSREVEALAKHREREEQRYRLESQRKEDLEHDEMGSARYLAARRKS